MLDKNQQEYLTCLEACPQGERTSKCPFKKYEHLKRYDKYKLATQKNNEIELHQHRNCYMIKYLKQMKEKGEF